MYVLNKSSASLALFSTTVPATMSILYRLASIFNSSIQYPSSVARCKRSDMIPFYALELQGRIRSILSRAG